jgi:hypothetical protein
MKNGDISKFVILILNYVYVNGRMEVTERINIIQERDCI